MASNPLLHKLLSGTKKVNCSNNNIKMLADVLIEFGSTHTSVRQRKNQKQLFSLLNKYQFTVAACYSWWSAETISRFYHQNNNKRAKRGLRAVVTSFNSSVYLNQIAWSLVNNYCWQVWCFVLVTSINSSSAKTPNLWLQQMVGLLAHCWGNWENEEKNSKTFRIAGFTWIITPPGAVVAHHTAPPCCSCLLHHMLAEIWPHQNNMFWHFHG